MTATGISSRSAPNEIATFVDCVRKDTEPPFGTRGEDGLAALEIVMAIYQSARTGKVVKVKRPIPPFVAEHSVPFGCSYYAEQVMCLISGS